MVYERVCIPEQYSGWYNRKLLNDAFFECHIHVNK